MSGFQPLKCCLMKLQTYGVAAAAMVDAVPESMPARSPGDDTLTAVFERPEEPISFDQTGRKGRKEAPAGVVAQDAGLLLHVGVRSLGGMGQVLLRIVPRDPLGGEGIQRLLPMRRSDELLEKLLSIHGVSPFSSQLRASFEATSVCRRARLLKPRRAPRPRHADASCAPASTRVYFKQPDTACVDLPNKTLDCPVRYDCELLVTL
jgi:hypothetical protein